MLGVNVRLLSLSPSLCYRQKSSYGTTHIPICWNRLRLQISVNCWFLIQLLSTEAMSDLPPPVLAQNYDQEQPIVLSVGLGSDLREVSIAGFWAELSSGTTHCSFHWNRLRSQRGVNCWLLIHLLSTKSSLNLPPPLFARNYHQAQLTVLSVEIGSYFS